MTDLFGEPVKIIRNPKAYAAMPGSGPERKKCKDCEHYEIHRSRTYRQFRKCGLIKSTCGKATDILANSPACSFFKEES